jgi:hypothetical protein
MAEDTTTSTTAASRGQVQLANDDPRYQYPSLIDPSLAGFVQVGVQTGAKRRPGPIGGTDEHRDEVIAILAAYAADAARIDTVREVAVFRAVLLSPSPTRGPVNPVQPDAALLIETATPTDASAVGTSPEVAELLDRLDSAGARDHVLVARNARRIADVDHIHGRLFLFNHFFAEDEDIAIALWERLAAWYERETGLRDSILLAPIDRRDSVFALVNHASFDTGLLRLFVQQFAKRSFFTYVQANMRANDVVAMPVLYRLVWAIRGPSPAADG